MGEGQSVFAVFRFVHYHCSLCWPFILLSVPSGLRLIRSSNHTQTLPAEGEKSIDRETDSLRKGAHNFCFFLHLVLRLLTHPLLKIIQNSAVISHLIYPLTARVVGAPKMISLPVSSFFPLFSTALWDLANYRPVQCPFPDVVFPPLPLSAFSSPFHCALQDGFGQT